MCDEMPLTALLENTTRDSWNTNTSSANRIDFVELFPPELSVKLFSYLPDKDLFSCSACNWEWRKTVNNDGLWKVRCKRRGWVKSQNSDPKKWAQVLSHVDETQPTSNYRPSPLFATYTFLNVDNMDIEFDPLCDWALYFRHCVHLQNNWTKGIYTVQEMELPEYPEVPCVQTASSISCNEKYLLVSSHTGYIFLWCLEGVPRLIRKISPDECNAACHAIEITLLSSEFMVILYENKEIKMLSLSVCNGDKERKIDYDHFDKVGIHCIETGNQEFLLELVEQPMLVIPHVSDNDREDIQSWVQSWINWSIDLANDRSTYTASDLIPLITGHQLILTGENCKNFVTFDISTNKLTGSFVLPSHTKCCSKGVVTSSNLLLSAKKLSRPETAEHGEVCVFYLLVFPVIYNSVNAEDCFEVSSISEIEEIQPDESSERVVYVSHQGTVTGFNLSTKEFLFLHQSNACVDNLLVAGDYILYHRFHGCIFALNWHGEVLYDIDAHVGLVRGIRCVNQFIISAGDARELSVWELKTGMKLYTVHRQPNRIVYLFANETKIVTVGKQDPPVLIGFW